MPYCQYCGEKVDKGVVFCPKCGEIVVGKGTKWRRYQIQKEINEAKHKANMRIISAIILVTFGIIGGGILCVSSGSVGLFGAVLVCLGIGCAAAAYRHEYKAQNLQKRLSH